MFIKYINFNTLIMDASLRYGEMALLEPSMSNLYAYVEIPNLDVWTVVMFVVGRGLGGMTRTSADVQ